MAKQVVVEQTKAPRRRRRAAVSSGARGRALDGVLQYFEAVDETAAAATGLSSAGMRAGAIVRGMRRSAGLSQTELAKRLQVSQERISEIERGAGPQGPTFDVLERIAAACGMVLTPLAEARAAELAAEAQNGVPIGTS